MTAREDCQVVRRFDVLEFERAGRIGDRGQCGFVGLLEDDFRVDAQATVDGSGDAGHGHGLGRGWRLGAVGGLAGGEQTEQEDEPQALYRSYHQKRGVAFRECHFNFPVSFAETSSVQIFVMSRWVFVGKNASSTLFRTSANSYNT